MQVFKFGGASVQSIDHIKHVAEIVRQYPNEKLWIVVSAMGKTTNALEKVAEAFYQQKKEDALRLFDEVKKQHLTIAKYLLVMEFNECLARMAELFAAVENVLQTAPAREYNYYYDQIVSVGELLSSRMVSAYLNEVKIKNTWLDVREVLRTDACFREANVDWTNTEKFVEMQAQSLFQENNIALTQGFIGGNSNKETTTHGREGSDFSAAVFAHILHAEKLIIWKDVPGVMNADPKFFPEAAYIPHLNYTEAIEMAYYGAQIIHPKTIKPLQNKNIPLLVKCFADAGLPGTTIDEKTPAHLPPIIILKNNQVLLTLRTADFSFFVGLPIIRLYKAFGELGIKSNFIQTDAIGVQIVIDDVPEKIDVLAQNVSAFFNLQVAKGFHLLTLRHYDENTLEKYLQGKEKVLFQQNAVTVQVLYR